MMRQLEKDSKSSPPRTLMSDSGTSLPLNESMLKLKFPQIILSSFKDEPPLSNSVINISYNNFIRVIASELQTLGYNKSAIELERESGVSIDNPIARELTRAILEGSWSLAQIILPRLNLIPSSYLEILSILYEQEYLELLESGDSNSALSMLRNRITPTFPKIQKIAIYSKLLLCCDLKLMQTELGCSYLGKKIPIKPGLDRRRATLSYIQHFVPPELMAPGKRLEELVRQALCAQILVCPSHTVSIEEMDIFKNHSCDQSKFPALMLRRISEHTDEVLHVSFSNDGKRLASASKDFTIRLFMTEDFVNSECKSYCVLRAHFGWVQSCAWSPDNIHLLSVSNDATFCLWNILTGELIFQKNRHKMAVTSCAWFPDGSHFVTGSMDRSLLLWTYDGNLKGSVLLGRVNDICITPECDKIYASCNDTIRVVRVDTMKDIKYLSIPVPEGLHSIVLSSDGRHLLCSMANTSMHLWYLHNREIVAVYKGNKGGLYHLRCTFGGGLESFVACGSNDNGVYIWHRLTQRLVAILRGHSSVVTCVAWNKEYPNLLASCSDDHTVIVWSATSSGLNTIISSNNNNSDSTTITSESYSNSFSVDEQDDDDNNNDSDIDLDQINN